jgi:IgGFc binding protein
VKIKVSSTGQIAAGAGIPATAAGGTLSLTLNAGDVAQLLGPGGADLSGSLVQASAAVQVITGHPCIQIPPTQPACDHIEESVFPAETMGRDYVVTRPAGPSGTAVQHQVHIYGNVDGTMLTYNPAPPPGCPTSINAGQVVECGTPTCPTTIDVTAPMSNCGIMDRDFEVKGTQPFSVGTFTLGAFVADPANRTYGDPAQSFATAVEQYRSKYVFLAPSDYTVSYVDIVAKAGTTMTLDNAAVTTAPQAVGTSGYSVYRVQLGAGQAGAHVLGASQPVGIQVVGYGSYTSYMYPGGLDLQRIALPPPPIQ